VRPPALPEGERHRVEIQVGPLPEVVGEPLGGGGEGGRRPRADL
jgi:hypothetical protein